MDTPITREEHEEFRRRIEEENKRQDKRIALLEEQTREIGEQNASIERLAVNMEHMLTEQVAQGKRLEVLEKRDGEMWRKVTGYIITTIVGLALGLLATHIGLK